jgi:hypothetical protein
MTWTCENNNHLTAISNVVTYFDAHDEGEEEKEEEEEEGSNQTEKD